MFVSKYYLLKLLVKISDRALHIFVTLCVFNSNHIIDKKKHGYNKLFNEKFVTHAGEL